jgi:pSer/pThr/pTyr-binding forkhead associated (FHA) protein
MAILKVGGTEEALELRDRTEYVLGRLDEPSKSFPDIDLEPFGGRDAGVSRQHAKLIQLGNGLNYLVDLSSTNGTLINDEPLEPLKHARLQDGDRIELGDLSLIFIEHPADEE